MKPSFFAGLILIPVFWCAAEPVDLQRHFPDLLKEIKPSPSESSWREIAWLTDVTEARRRAVAEDKPLVIFTAADGSPLGRT